MVALGLKTSLYGDYKKLVQKCNIGLEGNSLALKGVQGVVLNQQKNDVLTCDKVLTEMAYMAYAAVGGKKPKLNKEPLYSIPDVSNILWAYYMSIRSVAIAWANVKKTKSRLVPPYILSDLERIFKMQHIAFYSEARGDNGIAHVDIRYKGWSYLGTLNYARPSETYGTLTNIFKSLLRRTLFLPDNEISYIEDMLKAYAYKVKSAYEV